MVLENKKDMVAMLEKTLERKLVQAVKARGGLAPKLVCPGFDGMPDRLLLLPFGRIAFVEVKRPGMRPRRLQIHIHEMLRRLGFLVYVIDDERQIEGVLDEI